MQTSLTTTSALVRYNAVHCRDSWFCLFYDRKITYQELDKKTDAFAAWLQSAGVSRGDTVSFMVGNSPEFFMLFFGAQKIGAIAGPISCWWQADEVEFLINDCCPRVLVMDMEYVGILQEISDRIPSVEKIVINAPGPLESAPDHELLSDILSREVVFCDTSPPGPKDTASLMYTSGTTGKPKGVMVSHRGIMEGAHIKTRHIPIDPGERILCVLPLFHTGGINDLSIPTMYSGGTIVLRRNFSASEFWQCVEQYRVNGFYIVPTMWNILLRVPEADTVDTTSLRMCVSGAAPIPPAQLDECEKRFGIPILEGYGATENSGGITANSPKQKKTGSIGTAFDGLEVRIFDERHQPVSTGNVGEIVVKGDTVMQGYFNNPEATAETIVDGYLHTGDIGYMDEDGFLFIVDRKKDMIIRGGVNVYPKEIENVIKDHPRVDNVAVIPEPDEKYGQTVKACVVLKRGENATEKEIIGFCEKHLASYKVPALVLFRESLPANAVGKVLKKDLARELEEELSAEPVPVAHFFADLPRRFLPEKAQGINATISYNITGKGGGKWTVAVKDRTLTLTRGILKDPLVYLVARDRDYADIVTGKLDSITAVVTGKLKIEGDVNFMAQFREMFKPLETA